MRSICGKAIPVLLVACKTDLREKAMSNGTYSPERFIDQETVRRRGKVVKGYAYDREPKSRSR